MNTPDPVRTLRTLDPAAAELTGAQRDRAAALLERIVTTDPDAAPAAGPGDLGPVPVRRRRTRLAIAAGVAAIAVGGAIVLPGLTGSDMAYASWTATPSAVAARDLEASTARCREELAAAPRSGLAFDAASVPVVLAERRGDIVAVLFHQEQPTVDIFCLATVEPGSGTVENVATGLTEGGGDEWIPPAGQIAEGAMGGFGDQAWMVAGTAGEGVESVTLHVGDTAVTATVEDGRYFAWGPGRAFSESPFREGGPASLFTYDMRLRDGSVRTGVSPARPGGGPVHSTQVGPGSGSTEGSVTIPSRPTD